MRGYRGLFALAAVYNLAFGIWTGFFPLSFFHLFHLDPPRYPSLWACVGMVIGVYAIAYAYAVWRPERADLLIAIGLCGKVLGPLGWLVAVACGELPPRTFPLILTNDLVWWFPFLFYLLREHRLRPLIISWIAVVLHVLACALLLLARDGTEVMPDLEARRTWVGTHAPLWTATWFAWALSSMSLVPFTVIWARHLLMHGAIRGWAITGCGLVAAGLPFDLAGESANLMWTACAPSVADFADAYRAYHLLSVATANGLYCLGGLVLSMVSWRIGWLQGGLGLLALTMWTVGLLLTVMALADNDLGMVVTGGAVMVLFIPFAACLGWWLRPARSPVS